MWSGAAPPGFLPSAPEDAQLPEAVVKVGDSLQRVGQGLVVPREVVQVCLPKQGSDPLLELRALRVVVGEESGSVEAPRCGQAETEVLVDRLLLAAHPVAADGPGVGMDDALLAGLKRDNMTIGGALTYGDYDCAVQMDKGMKYTLSLYDNGQYRITGDGSSDGEYQYSPSGYINVNDDVFLYNHTSTFGHGVRELAFYFTDHGKPGLYGQNIANNIIVVCAYSGAAKGPSPAQEAVDRAEAARFKWVTAPGQGVQDKDIETLLFHGEAEYFGTDITFVETQYLLLKDGWAYDNMQVPPADLDVAASRQHEPEHWRRWRKQGDNYQYEKDGQWQAYDATPVRPGKAGETLDGTYTYSTSSGTLYTGSHVSFTYLTFGKDGSFSRSRYSSSASSNYIDSSTFANSEGVVSGVYDGFQDSGTVTVGSTGTGGKGEERPGHYKIDGYTIELTYPNGKTERELFFFWNNERNNLNIGKTTYSTD